MDTHFPFHPLKGRFEKWLYLNDTIGSKENVGAKFGFNISHGLDFYFG